MTQDVRLYINDMLVDFSNELSLPFTYQLEDLNNPTIIKNSFTKTITIVGTKNNNKIFGEIYNLDREQLYDNNYIVGAYFNPSYRTPFILYRDAEIIESGYMQLNNVTIKNNIINYNITLYGGLGDFFYNLSYNDKSELLQLKDLDYGVNLSFNMDKEIIKDSWQILGGEKKEEENTVGNIITFIPTYNGMYEDFDNDKVLINTSKSTLFPSTSKTVDGITYTPYNGYAKGELNKEFTEWEMKSLMSYKQRPALKLSKFIEACCNPKNNGGYKVELDDTFFNHSNPYYYKTYIALPLLGENIDIDGEQIEDNITIKSDVFVGFKNGTEKTSVGATINVIGSNISMDSNGIINTDGMNNSTLFDIDLDVQLFFHQTGSTKYTSDLYTSTTVFFPQGMGMIYDQTTWLNSVVLQIEAVNADNNLVIGQSDYYNFTSKINYFNNQFFYSNPKIWKNWSNPTNVPVQNVFGHFIYDDNTDKHYFRSEDKNNTFRIKLEKCKRAENIKFQLVLKLKDNRTDGNICGLYKNTIISVNEAQSGNQYVVGYWNSMNDTSTSKLYLSTGDIDIASGQKITQDILLKSENTPCDFLLSYCKLFGLYFTRDIAYKKISIMKRNNFFTGNIKDITDKIDYSKDFVINPILYDKKFYRLNLKSNEDYINEKYKNEYGVEYGQKRINTNYNFNNETVDLLKDNVYQNVISTVDNSVYYRTFYNSAGTEQPPFIIDDMVYKTFNVNGAEIKETDTEIKGRERIDLSKSVNWNTKGGFDYTDKLCCFTKDSTKTLKDISASLVFFDDVYIPTDLNGDIVQYWLVDDVPEMFILNEKQCHLFTENEFDKNNNWIAWKIPYIPKFSKYLITNNKIVDSWDFSKPKELYMPDIVYSDNIAIYDQYWNNFFEDKLNINTKKITAYVNFKNFIVNENILKDFYYFNNCYWLLNKIENYDVNSDSTVKCEFIKINDISNYTGDIGKRYDYFYLDNNYIVVPYSAGVAATTIHSTTPWEISWYNSSKITNISPMSGEAGKTVINVEYNENDDFTTNPFYISFSTTGNVKNSMKLDFIQEPDKNNIIKLTGKIKYINGSLIPNGRVVIYDVDTSYIYDSKKLNEYTGAYTIYLPKGKKIGLEVQTTDSQSIYDNTFTYSEDSVLNINIFRL